MEQVFSKHRSEVAHIFDLNQQLAGKEKLHICTTDEFKRIVGAVRESVPQATKISILRALLVYHSQQLKRV